MSSLAAKKLFLMDALGALASALCLISLLTQFNAYVGMPRVPLSILSAMALIFCGYSTLCFFYVPTPSMPFLCAIITANVLYGCLTTGLVMVYYAQLTALGLSYFVLEIIVLSIIVFIEIKATQT